MGRNRPPAGREEAGGCGSGGPRPVRVRERVGVILTARRVLVKRVCEKIFNFRTKGERKADSRGEVSGEGEPAPPVGDRRGGWSGRPLTWAAAAGCRTSPPPARCGPGCSSASSRSCPARSGGARVLAVSPQPAAVRATATTAAARNSRRIVISRWEWWGTGWAGTGVAARRVRRVSSGRTRCPGRRRPACRPSAGARTSRSTGWASGWWWPRTAGSGRSRPPGRTGRCRCGSC